MKKILVGLFLATFAADCDLETSPDYLACEERIFIKTITL